MTALDTSIVVAAFATRHDSHEAARQAVTPEVVIPAHVVTETYAVLTRMPEPFHVRRRRAGDGDHHGAVELIAQGRDAATCVMLARYPSERATTFPEMALPGPSGSGQRHSERTTAGYVSPPVPGRPLAPALEK